MRIHLLMVGLIGLFGILVARSSQILSMPETLSRTSIETAIISIVLLGIGYIGARVVL
ncbi:MAG: hypothetical protein MUP66_00355 [Candidatus Nanohaloarchaeota archaeon QJJ-5]|nr:hypothetical protein [Candidatus Nanohaloarchaeota archaeon QJJ-5]